MKKKMSKNEIIAETWEKRAYDYDKELNFIIRGILITLLMIILGILIGYIIVSWT